MEGIDHKSITVNGINMHVAEIGQGPFVLFLHGFPECWYSWRHQMTFMARHGFRAVALDLRGYGDTTGAPVNDFTKFTTLHVVGDVVALLNAVAAQEEKVFVVGHDWGAMIAWALCLYRPDRVKALVNLSVAFLPRNPSKKPVESLLAVYGEDYYICRFQEPGEIEGEFAQMGTRRVLKNFLTYDNPGPLYLPKGKGFGESADTPIILPSWLSEEEVDYYASKYEKSGFTGALNYYRALDKNWELTAPWTGDQIKVPVKFIVGDLDLTYNAPGSKDFIHKGGFKRYVPLLKEVVVMEGAPPNFGCAALGDWAVAPDGPDLRGYGDTPDALLVDLSKSTVLHIVGNLIALLDAVAWMRMKSDEVKALVNFIIAFIPRSPEINPMDMFHGAYGEDHYTCRFQEPEDIEAEFAQIGTKEILKNIFAFRTPAKFEQTGSSGGVNYYCALGSLVRVDWNCG
ncbi:unnamed protein product [Fraxinus pennsylvanica]|uniref:soluble epoxide hydrolase n=1 Tax=Fraxinus pennsylvanica TaxID=56036 RepID=A0AAD2E247_9LAMI|nr:unnamed protein product [Fraxinus pennsylvanica]